MKIFKYQFKEIKKNSLLANRPKFFSNVPFV